MLTATAAMACLVESTITIDNRPVDVRVVEGVERDILKAYAFAVASHGRVRRGIADAKQRLASEVLPALREKASGVLQDGPMAFMEKNVGQCFWIESGRVKQSFFYKDF